MNQDPIISEPAQKGLLAWFAKNHVAANLLMFAIIATGIVTAFSIKQEVFPSFERDTVTIRMVYLGASPEEVERTIVQPIEAEIRGLEIVKRLESIASESSAQVTIEIRSGYDRNRALQEVTAAVQRINLFPSDAEPPVITLGDGRRRSVLSIAVYGDLDERTLVDYARQLESGLLADPDISIVEVRGARRPEIHIEASQPKLRALGLTLDQIARGVDASALDVPAGQLRTPGGDVLLKTTERREFADQFKDIEIASAREGGKILLGDIAEVTDTFEETEREVYYNGKRAVFISVYSTESQPPLKVAAAVRAFIEEEKKNLPESVGVTLSRDSSDDYQERLHLLFNNGALGLLLVLLALGLFLELRVAFWTAVGIPVSILGSLVLLPLMDASINMISLFGFIITLGIVVDDAVVVGEDIFHKISIGMSRMDAAVEGVKQMTTPVVFAVTTNILAFLPLLFVTGESGRFFKVLPAVVIAVFAVSLVECLFVLPAHLSGGEDKKANKDSWFARLDRRQNALRVHIDKAMERIYEPTLKLAVDNRYLTLTVFFVGLVVLVAYIFSGRLDFAFRPTIETTFIQAEIAMPSGTPVNRTREVAFLIEAAAKRAVEKNGEKDIVVGYFVEVASRSASTCEVSVTLVPQSQREITSQVFAEKWREEIGVIPDLESIFFDYLFGPGGEAEVDILLSHPEVDTLRLAAEEVAAAVDRYPGTEDVRKGFGREMPQMNFEIKPEGRSLGITARELGRQIRNSFFGATAIRQPRDRDELRVMVKLPREDRRSMAGLENLLIRSPQGGEIPLNQAASITMTNAPVRIERVDGSRVLNVTANVIPGVNNGAKILASLKKNELPDIMKKFPGLRYSFEGEQREQRESMESLSWGLVAAMFIIFAIIASLLHSYAQAIIVLLTIPWSLAGAALGHILLGFDISVFSIFGMIALCGMVINGAFVLAVTRNRFAASGIPLSEVTQIASLRRFRPILLTSITTFLGLMPMIFETSVHSLFLVPMAISLGVGTLVSSVVILFLIPAVMVIYEETIGSRLLENPRAPSIEM